MVGCSATVRPPTRVHERGRPAAPAGSRPVSVRVALRRPGTDWPLRRDRGSGTGAEVLTAYLSAVAADLPRGPTRRPRAHLHRPADGDPQHPYRRGDAARARRDV